MHTRRGRWTTVLALIGALILAGAIYEAWRTPAKADAETTAAERQAAIEGDGTPIGMWTPDMWAEREKALRTDEEAKAYAEDFTILMRTIVPVSDPAAFYENTTLVKVAAVRGPGAASVWEAHYDVEVGSNETTFTTVYPTSTRFGPGLTPADSPPRGIEDVFAFADMQYFSKDQRVAFLRYCNANKVKDLHIVARLDREFPGAAWYEDTAFRAQLLATGEKAGFGPSDLAYYFLDHEQVGTLAGYDADTQTWRTLKVAPYNYAKWYANRAAAEARAQAKAQAAVQKAIAKAEKSKKAKAAAKPAGAQTAASTPQAATATRQPTQTASTPSASTGTQATPTGAAPTGNEAASGGTIPATSTPWYNLLAFGAVLLLLGAAGLVLVMRTRHA